MLFVNGRMIRSPILSLPLREACDGVLAKGLHPPAVLFFLVDPSAVDCNVHPAKREVRFRDPALVRSVAFQAAKLAWKEASPYSGLERFGEISNTVSSSWIASARSYQGEFESQGSNLTAPIQEASSSAFIAPPSSFSLNCPRSLGLLSDRYLLFEDQESLLMVEIRGARERILYERYLKQLGSGDLESQRLLLPEVLEMSPAELLWIDAHRSLLHKAGLVAESFGTGSLKIDAIPADAVALPILDILVRLVDELRTCEDSTSLDQKAKEAIASSVGHLAAVGAHMPAGEEAAQLLLRELLSCDLPYSTPKGRPTMSQLGSRELVRRFTA
jgi:DNA mismatch repair protein MutL